MPNGMYGGVRGEKLISSCSILKKLFSMTIILYFGGRIKYNEVRNQPGHKGSDSMYIFVEVMFHSGQRGALPRTGYRPDAIFNKSGDYWGITFIDLQPDKFDEPTLAIITFTFQDSHYKEVGIGQRFFIMEGSRQVGEGKIISIFHSDQVIY